MALRLPVDGPVDLLLVTGVRDGWARRRRRRARRAARRPALHRRARHRRPGNARPTTPTALRPDGRAPTSVRSVRPVPPGDATAAALAARALGPGATRTCSACRVPTATAAIRWSTAVARTLWPATWGYWLTQFVGLGTAGLDLDDCDWARDHAARYVRPGGPLPTLRVGRQPYGLLPVDGAHPVPGRCPRDPARRDRRRPDRRRLAAGARQGGTSRTRRPGDGPRRRAAPRRAARTAWRCAAPSARRSPPTPSTSSPAPCRTEAWLALAARTQALTAAAGLSADDRRRAGPARAHGLAGRPAARGRRSRHRPARPARHRCRRRRRRDRRTTGVPAGGAGPPGLAARARRRRARG